MLLKKVREGVGQLVVAVLPTLKIWWFLLKKNPVALGGGFVLFLIMLLGLLAPVLTRYDPTQPDARAILLPPSTRHLMGTDDLGMDIFTRVIYGARLEFLFAFFAVIGASIVGCIYGVISAFYGGWLDELMMRFLDSLQAFPGLLLGMALAAALRPSARNVIIVLIVVNFPIYARLVRSQALSLKQATFVDAARVVGNNDFRIIFKYLLPNALGPIYVTASLNIGWTVLMASSLSFVGLGVPAPTPEWGLMVSQGARHMIFGKWWPSFFPGLFIFLFVLAANLFGDGLRDLLSRRR